MTGSKKRKRGTYSPEWGGRREGAGPKFKSSEGPRTQVTVTLDPKTITFLRSFAEEQQKTLSATIDIVVEDFINSKK